MKTKSLLIGMGVFGGVAVFVGLMIFMYVVSTYNGFVSSRNVVDTQWSQVETMYQRRLDLIPNLANAARGYIAHEEKVFSDIAEARTHYAGVAGEDKVQAQSALEGAFARLLVIMENYPNLKADQTVKDLMFELSGTENRVNVARQRYNEEVKLYNTGIQVFPGNLVANAFGFKDKTLYVSQPAAVNAPIINLEVK